MSDKKNKIDISDLPAFSQEGLDSLKAQETKDTSSLPAYEETDLSSVSQDEARKAELDKELEEFTPTQSEALLRGGTSGLTLGFKEEAKGGLRALKEIAGPKADLSQIKELYQQYRDIERAKEAKAKEAFPKSYLGGQIAGGIAASLVPGGAATTIARGATLGGLTALGESEADLTKGEYGKAALAATGGAVLGGGMFKAGTALSKALTPEAMKQKAIGKVAEKMGQISSTLDEEAAETVGKAFYKYNILDKSGMSKQAKKLIPKAIEANRKEHTAALELIQNKMGNVPPEVKQKLAIKLDAFKNEQLGKLKFGSKEIKEEFEAAIVPLIDEFKEKALQYSDDIVALSEIKKRLNQEAQDAYAKLVLGQTLESTSKGNAKIALSRIFDQALEDLGEAAQAGLGKNLSRLDDFYSGLKVGSDTLKSGAKRLEAATMKEMHSLGDAIIEGSIAVAHPQFYAAKLATKAAIKASEGMGPSAAFYKSFSKKLEKVPGLSETVKGITETTSGKTTPVQALEGVKEGASSTWNFLTGSEPVKSSSPEPVKSSSPPPSTQSSTAGDSRRLIDRNNEQIRAVLEDMRDVDLQDEADTIESAMNENNNTAKNARMMALMQNPRTRKILSKILNKDKQGSEIA